jgi:hypothetical protein
MLTGGKAQSEDRLHTDCIQPAKGTAKGRGSNTAPWFGNRGYHVDEAASRQGNRRPAWTCLADSVSISVVTLSARMGRSRWRQVGLAHKEGRPPVGVAPSAPDALRLAFGD